MLFDTNFLIAYGKGSKDVPKARARAYFAALPHESPFYISRVTWMEFIAGFENMADAEFQLAPFTIIEVDTDLWRQGALVIRDLGLRGKTIGAADSLIAATALSYGFPLVSNNTKHFREVRGLDLRNY